MRSWLLILVLALGAQLFPFAQAHAACSNPAGVAGQVFYSNDFNVLQYCDDTNWIAMGQGPQSGGGCANPTGVEGETMYNADFSVPQYCNGYEWVAMGPIGAGGGGGGSGWTLPPEYDRVLNNPSPTPSDSFSASVALSGTTAVVGTYWDDPGGVSEAGTVYVFDTTDGSLVSTLNNPSPVASDLFGYSVAVDGTVAVVGVPYDDTGGDASGIVYVFDTTTGNLTRTLNNPNADDAEIFGFSVAVSGTTAVVGAPGNPNGDGVGIAYVFNTSNGNLIATINNPNAGLSDSFGASVAVDGTVAVIGAYGVDVGAANAGVAYVFDTTDGSLIATLSNPAPSIGDNFGSDVAIDGTTAVVREATSDRGYVFDTTDGSLTVTLDPPAVSGAAIGVAIEGTVAVIGVPNNSIAGGIVGAGTAYVFDVTTGSLTATLNNPSPTTNDGFGDSVAVSGTTVLVGAYQDDPDGVNNAGTAYVFDATEDYLSTPVLGLINPNPTASDFFGFDVAVSGTTAVVGSYQDDPGAVSAAGIAYAFNTTNGSLVSTLSNPNPTASDFFGYSVAVSGTMAVVGSYQDDPGAVSAAGIAYVFDTTDGSLIATLNNPGPTASDFFGYDVAIDGTTAVVGAYQDDPGGVSAAGTAYVFDATDGSLIATLNNPDPTASDLFGKSVAVSGTMAVISSENDDPGAVDAAGTAYVFDTTDGSLIATLNNPDPTTADQFSYSVAISGTTAVIGTFADDPGGVSGAGTAYVFDATDGTLITTLSNPEPTISDSFGISVAVSGTAAVVGAHQDDPGGISAAGTAYVFDTTDGTLTATLNNPDPTATDNFARNVAITDTVAVVGAYQDDPGGISAAGKAWVFYANGPASCTSPAGAPGELLYNSASNVMQFCNGASWVGIGKGI